MLRPVHPLIGEGMIQPSGALPARLTLPFWLWLLAPALGLLLAAVSLSYAPTGRLNVLWLWWLWAGLPLLGALISAAVMVFGRARPWLFRWRQWRLHWYPKPAQRWQMLYRLQWFWLLTGLGLCAGFWVLLLFADLAFGWSSTLLDGGRTPAALFQWLASPWAALWPEAVPDGALLEATRYSRVDPTAADLSRTGDWWPFLMASLVAYNLLPRALLAAFSYGRWRFLARPARQPAVDGPDSSRVGASDRPLMTARADQWRQATQVNWERPGAGEPSLGASDWHADEQTLQRLLAGSPSRLLWQVSASRSPVAELADLVARARSAGVAEQGLQAMPDERTHAERHLASWRQFARDQQLIWVAS